MQLPSSHLASAFQSSIVSLQGQLMFLSSRFLLFYLHCCSSKIDPRDCVQSQSGECAMFLRSLAGVATLGISLVTLNFRLHDTRSQNTGDAGTCRPVWRNGFFFKMGVRIVQSELQYLKMIKAAGLSFIINKAAVPNHPSISSLVLYFTSHFKHRLHSPIWICPHEQNLTHRKYMLVLRFYLLVLCKGVYFSITPLCAFMWRSKCLRTEKVLSSSSVSSKSCSWYFYSTRVVHTVATHRFCYSPWTVGCTAAELEVSAVSFHPSWQSSVMLGEQEGGVLNSNCCMFSVAVTHVYSTKLVTQK